jgi:hypothetical protein
LKGDAGKRTSPIAESSRLCFLTLRRLDRDADYFR